MGAVAKKFEEYVAERFREDTREHRLEVLLDDTEGSWTQEGGAPMRRHLRFERPGTRIYQFDLVTWPGVLCITGDTGTYVFSRVRDMMAFFRGEKINPGYWAEKLLAIDRHGGPTEYDPEVFEERVRDYFAAWAEGRSPAARAAAWSAVEAEVLTVARNGEQHAALEAAAKLDAPGGFRLYPLLEDAGDVGRRYTFGYLWCLNAIVWGIARYDFHRENRAAAPATGAAR